MAQGDSKLAQEYPLQAGKGVYNNTSDTFRIAFVSETYAAIDATAAPFNLSLVTPVSGGNFPATPTALTGVTWTRTGAESKLDYNDLAAITKNASNPTTIRCSVIYNDTSPSDDIYKVVDLTTDGTTPIDVVTNDFDYAVAAAGAMTCTVV